jgi:hypothetical protein
MLGCGFSRRSVCTRILTLSPSPFAARTLAACPPHQRAYLTDLFDATRPSHRKRLHENRHWQHWATFAVSIGQHPPLPDTQTQANHLERTMLFLAFAVALQQGRFHNGHHVCGAESERTLHKCAQLMVVEGLDDPCKSDTSGHCLARSITLYIKSCKSDDPPAHPQQAIPSSTIRWIATPIGSSQHHQTRLTAHLIVLAFFSCSGWENTQEARRNGTPSPCARETFACGAQVSSSQTMHHWTST